MEIAILKEGDAARLDDVAPGVFDHAIGPTFLAEFFADPRHHLAVAIDEGTVVGMASAVHYVHPDKAPELWINEVGVAPIHRRQGLGQRLLDALFAHGRELGCREAWVLTEEGNAGARRLYESAGGRASRCTMFSFGL